MSRAFICTTHRGTHDPTSDARPRGGRGGARTDAIARFVGRDDEVAHLRDVVARSAAGVPATVVVLGDAGVGKSSLVREAMGDVDADVAVITGDETESTLDLGLVHQLEQRLGGTGGTDAMPADPL